VTLKGHAVRGWNLPSNKKKWLPIVLICGALLTGVGLIYWGELPFRSSTTRIASKTGAYLSMSRNALNRYYGEHRNESAEDVSLDFSRYLANADSNFSVRATDTKNPGRKSIEFFLMLPERLESQGPLLIAYTSSFKYRRSVCRFAMFLRDGEFVIVLMAEGVLREIVGKEAFEDKKPDLYVHP